MNAKATDYFVAKTGNDSNSGLDSANAFAGVQKLCRILRAGETGFIYPGVYDEYSPLSADGGVNSGLKPDSSGTAGNPIIFRNVPGFAMPEIRGIDTGTVTDSLRCGGDLTGRSYVIYDSLNFSHGHVGIFLYGNADHITIQNCQIDSMGWSRSSGNNGGGVFTYLNDSASVVALTVRNCDIFDCWSWDTGEPRGTPLVGVWTNCAGILQYEGDSCLYIGNRIWNCPDGIRIKCPTGGDGPNPAVLSVFIDSNTVYDCVLNAFQIHNQGRARQIFGRGNVSYGSMQNAHVELGAMAFSGSDFFLDGFYWYNNTMDLEGGVAALRIIACDTSIVGVDTTFLRRNIKWFNNLGYLPKQTVSGGDNSGGFVSIFNQDASITNGAGMIGPFESDYNFIYDTTTSTDIYQWWESLSKNVWTLAEWVSNTAFGDNTLTADLPGGDVFVDRANHDYHLGDSAAVELTNAGAGSAIQIPNIGDAPTYIGAFSQVQATPDTSVIIGGDITVSGKVEAIQ